MDSFEKLSRGERASGTTTLITAALAAGKGIGGLLSGSLVLTTDALHSGVDVLPIFASWFGLKVSQKGPDEKFPYGYYKAESVSTLFISLFILYVSIEFLKEGYSKLFSISKISSPMLAGGVASVSILAAFFVSRYQRRVGKEINSQSLMANSKESMMDVFSSIIVLIAIILSAYQIRYVEGLVTILIAGLILKIGLETAKDSIYALMDVGPGEEVEREVTGVMESISDIEDFEGLKLRNVGPFVFGEVRVKVKEFIDVDKAHEITDRLEKRAKGEVERVDSITVHLEPYKAKREKLAIPLSVRGGLNSETSDHFGRANYFAFAFVDKDKKKIGKFEIVENEYKEKDVRAGLGASHFLAGEDVDALITNEIGEISFHTLRDHLINVYGSEGNTAKEVIEKYMDGELERLEEPTREKD